MQIGELSKLANTSAKTIRFYEESGLLPPPTREISNISIPVRVLRGVPLGMYTWCPLDALDALDALVFPTILGRTAHVVSACRRTGEPVSVKAASPART